VTRRSGRGPVAFIIPLIVLAGPLGATSCTKQPTPGGAASAPSSTLPFESPTKDQIGSATGIDFPPSVGEYRSVKLDSSSLDVTFTMAAADVTDFASASGLTLTGGKRLITHASPVWELNPTGQVSSGQVRHRGLTSTVEVVSDGSDRVRVRLAVTA